MATLTSRQKEFIVGELAVFETPSEVAEAASKEFGIEVSRQQVAYYDASKARNREKLKDEWVELFDRTREAFVEELEGIPVAKKAVRIKRLSKIADKAHGMRNYKMEMDALEQVAKEVGGAYSNTRKHEHAGPGGGPIETKATVQVYLPDNGRNEPK